MLSPNQFAQSMKSKLPFGKKAAPVRDVDYYAGQANGLIGGGKFGITGNGYKAANKADQSKADATLQEMRHYMRELVKQQATAQRGAGALDKLEAELEEIGDLIRNEASLDSKGKIRDKGLSEMDALIKRGLDTIQRESKGKQSSARQMIDLYATVKAVRDMRKDAGASSVDPQETALREALSRKLKEKPVKDKDKNDERRQRRNDLLRAGLFTLLGPAGPLAKVMYDLYAETKEFAEKSDENSKIEQSLTKRMGKRMQEMIAKSWIGRSAAFVKKSIFGIGAAVGAKAKDYAGRAGAFVRNKGARVATGIGRGVSAIGGVVKKGAGMAMDGIGMLLSRMAPMVAPLLAAIGPGIAIALAGYLGFKAGTKLWEALPDNVQEAISNVIGKSVDFVSNIGTKIADGFLAIPDLVSDAFKSIKEGLQSAATTVMNAVDSVMQPVLKAGAWIAEQMGNMQRLLGDAYSSFVSWIKSTPLGRFIKDLPENAANTAQNVRGAASGVIQRGANAAAGAVGSAVSATVGASGQVTQSVGNVVGSTKLSNAGASMVDKAAAVGGAAASSVQSAGRFVGKLVMPSDPSIGSIIQEASRKVGVDPGYMMAMAAQESGFNPNAKAGTSSATGLFQFIKGTWSSMVSKYGSQYGIGIGDVKDPKANATMGALYLRDNINAFTKATGSAPTYKDMYAMHFLGTGGGIKAATVDQNALAADVFPQAAAANKSLFYRDGQAITVGEFRGKLDAKVGSKAAAYNVAIGNSAGGATASGGASGAVGGSPTATASNGMPATVSSAASGTATAAGTPGATTTATAAGGTVVAQSVAPSASVTSGGGIPTTSMTPQASVNSNVNSTVGSFERVRLASANRPQEPSGNNPSAYSGGAQGGGANSQQMSLSTMPSILDDPALTVLSISLLG